MPSNPATQVDEILKSLQVLMDREEMLEKDKLWTEAEEVRRRILTLLDALIPLSQDLKSKGLLSDELRKRTDALLSRQQRNYKKRAQALNEIRSQLNEVRAAGTNLKILRPAYGKSVTTPRGPGSSNLDMKG